MLGMPELISAAELLGGFDDIQPMILPAPSRACIKTIKDKIEGIRPNYPEYKNTVLYQDDRCKRWMHVCNVTLQNGVQPLASVPAPSPSFASLDKEH